MKRGHVTRRLGTGQLLDIICWRSGKKRVQCPVRWLSIAGSRKPEQGLSFYSSFSKRFTSRSVKLPFPKTDHLPSCRIVMVNESARRKRKFDCRVTNCTVFRVPNTTSQWASQLPDHWLSTQPTQLVQFASSKVSFLSKNR